MRAPAVILAFLLIVACEPAPIEWTADRALAIAAPKVALTADGDAVLDTLGREVRPAALPAAVCPGSLRFARSGTLHVSVWWSPRPDSGALLLAARTTDGGATWSPAAPVDTLDRSVSGCRRTPPAVTADSATGYVHVAYGLVAPEGAGIFFAHSMDGGVTFHAPVAIVYGDRAGHASVASSGDLVAVAFEDPSGRSPRVGLALSRTMGHIFEDRMLPLSDDNGAATQPLVAVQGRRIAVAWRERSGARGDTVLRVRAGTLH